MNAGEFSRKRALIHRRAGNREAWARKVVEKLAREARALPIFVKGRLVAWRMIDGSIACEWIRYRDEASASVELVRIARDDKGTHRVPNRTYACPMCSGWHLTSDVKRK